MDLFFVLFFVLLFRSGVLVAFVFGFVVAFLYVKFNSCHTFGKRFLKLVDTQRVRVSERDSFVNVHYRFVLVQIMRFFFLCTQYTYTHTDTNKESSTTHTHTQYTIHGQRSHSTNITHLHKCGIQHSNECDTNSANQPNNDSF